MSIRKETQSHQIEGKVTAFASIASLLDYTQSITQDEPKIVQDKALTYIASKNAKYWDKNSIALVITLSRIEATLEHLSRAHNEILESGLHDEASVKRTKSIVQSMSGMVTQSTTLAQRLSLTTSQLFGSATKHVASNENSREVAQMALAQVSTSTEQPTDFAEMQKIAKAKLMAMNGVTDE